MTTFRHRSPARWQLPDPEPAVMTSRVNFAERRIPGTGKGQRMSQSAVGLIGLVVNARRCGSSLTSGPGMPQ